MGSIKFATFLVANVFLWPDFDRVLLNFDASGYYPFKFPNFEVVHEHVRGGSCPDVEGCGRSARGVHQDRAELDRSQRTAVVENSRRSSPCPRT
ncbi:hypothetical protein BGLA2_70045 [Burkholderia gladioli]|nr:hypothetical protein BGLA2_70045 [Burkholderia gladioli]